MSEATPPGRRAGERLAIWIALGLTAYVTYLTVRPLLLALVLAAALATITRPYERFIERRLRGRRRLASALTEIALFVCVLAPIAALATFIIERLVVEVAQLAAEVRSGAGPLERLADHFGPLAPLFRRLAAEVRPRLTHAAPELAQEVARWAASAGADLAHAGIALFILVLALYYFLVSGSAWRARIERLLPLSADEVRMFADRFHQVSVAVLVGHVGTAVAQGLVALGGYYLFRAPVPLVWGVLTAAAALIPGIGSLLVWGPIAIVVGIQHGWLWGLGLAIYGILVISSVDNLLRPILTRRGLRIHPLAIFIAIFGGIASFGLAGIFYGPLVIAIAITVLDVYELRLPRLIFRLPPGPASR
ncbi:MAG TPA: AI-2E family transporter [Polyangia bacterium]|jgi:predicted PurR-regulated permease PerM